MAVVRAPEEIAATAPYFESKQEESRRDTRTQAEKESQERRKQERESIKAGAIDYAKSQAQDEDAIKAQGAAMKRAAMINPALIPMIDKTEWMNTQAGLIEATNRYKNAVLDLMSGLTPDLAEAKEKARDLIGEPQVSRGALDELQRRGAVQLEEPEAPSMWNAVTQMLIGTIGQAFQNVSQSSLAAAEAEQVVTVTAANSAAYQAAEFASFKENRQRVMEINAQLQAQYQGDLINAMRDYEARADTAQWNYEQQLITAAFDEQRRYYELMGKAGEFDIAAEKIGADIGLQYLAEKQRVDTANVGIINQTRQFNAKMAAEIEGVTMRMIQDNRAFYQNLAKQNMGLYGKLTSDAMKTLAVMGGRGDVLYDQTVNAFSQIDYTPWTEDGRKNSESLQHQTLVVEKFMERLNERLDQMGLNPDKRATAYGNAVNNLMTFNANNMPLITSEISDKTLNAMISTPSIAGAPFSKNFNMDMIDPSDFIMPDMGYRPDWVENISLSGNVALTKYYGNLAQTMVKNQTRYSSSERQPLPEK